MEKDKELSFEEAVEDLEKVLKKLASPELPLEEAFNYYEQGVSLLKHCNESLDKVEKKVMLINDNGDESVF